jgi:predicted nucleic acid-binding protein
MCASRGGRSSSSRSSRTLAAAGLKARHPVAYADCFAAALAIARKGRLVAGDPEFRRLGKDIPIEWLSRREGAFP